jgi:hypothetical protein
VGGLPTRASTEDNPEGGTGLPPTQTAPEHGPVVQLPVEQKVTGSNPVGVAKDYSPLSHEVEETALEAEKGGFDSHRGYHLTTA